MCILHGKECIVSVNSANDCRSDDRRLKRGTVISVRTSSAVAHMFDRLVRYHSDALGVELTRGQVFELILAQELNRFEKKGSDKCAGRKEV